MSLFDEEQIMRTYTKDIKKKTLVEEIPDCYLDLTMDDAKENKEIMQLAL